MRDSALGREGGHVGTTNYSRICPVGFAAGAGAPARCRNRCRVRPDRGACGSDDGDEAAVGTASVPPTTVASTTTTTTQAPPEELRINDMRVLGSHNSYHLRPGPELYAAIEALSLELAEAIDYSHRPLAEQLQEFGVRQFEIDVYADPEGGLYANRAALPVIGFPAGRGRQ
jgi:Phosphoinositide phospholipase C, Ca2+-dependent